MPPGLEVLVDVAGQADDTPLAGRPGRVGLEVVLGAKPADGADVLPVGGVEQSGVGGHGLADRAGWR